MKRCCFYALEHKQPFQVNVCCSCNVQLLLHQPHLTVDVQKKQPGEDCTPEPLQSAGSSQSPVFSSDASSSQSSSSTTPPGPKPPPTEEPSPTCPGTREGKLHHMGVLASVPWIDSTWEYFMYKYHGFTVHGVFPWCEEDLSRPVSWFPLQARRPQKQPKELSAHQQNVLENQVQPAPPPSSRTSSSLCPPPVFQTSAPRLSPLGSDSDSEETPEKRPRPDGKEGSGEEAPVTPKQKNRRRCFRCQTKLELVQQELGSCRCGE